MSWFRTGGGTDTSDANATAADILLSKTAYVDDEKITGSMPNNGDVSHTIGAGEVYNVPAGYTSGGVITAIAAGATITVTYTSDFYNKTMTCTKGSTTYTQTTTSSGSTTFSVAESGTWTITCNGVSRTVDVVLEYSTQMAITKTITVYSAASDTVSFTDVNGAKTVTTDANGHGSVSITFIPPSQNITFTSSVAKNPTNLTADYSKTVTVDSNTTEVYVMPDNTVYWWGYGYSQSDAKTNGWTFTGANVVNSTKNTNSLGIHSDSSDNIGFFGSGTQPKASSGTIKVVAQGIQKVLNYYGDIQSRTQKSVTSGSGHGQTYIDSNTLKLYSTTYGANDYILINTYNVSSANIYACFVE